ncbi:MAG: DNA repair protein RadC [Crocinitomicaceae bacterium]|nr:DNA repair protein RadC [Crocinitomicaceae bacterium]
MNTNSSIKFWAEDDRPREKLMQKGRSALSDAELLAILLGTGTKTKSAVELARDVLRLGNNSLHQLGKLNCKEFQQIKGIGEAKAINIMAALELGRRRNELEEAPPEKITSSKAAYRLLSPYFQDLAHEEFRIIALNRANHVLGTPLISQGGVTGTVADGKIIFKTLIQMNACACILAHNHPSGQLKPSDADIKLTKKLRSFGELVEINILDHLILTDHGYFSFSDEGIG